MGAISLPDLVTAIRGGLLSGEQAREVLRTAAPSYARPTLDLVRPGQDDIGDYLKWSDRTKALAAEIRDIVSSVEVLARESPALLRPVGDLVIEADRLLGGGLFRVSFRFGYAAWEHQDFRMAVHFLEQAGNAAPEDDEFIYCTALTYLVDSLMCLKSHESASYWLEIFKQRAESQGLRGYLSLAYLHLSRLRQAQGRLDEALAAIRSGISLRQSLTAEEVSGQSVAFLSGFQHTAGLIARKLGLADESIIAFQQACEEHLEREEYDLAAIAMSDIGFTYASIGDAERADKYIRRAAELATRHGRTELAGRWIAEIQPETAVSFQSAEADVSASEAYARSVAISAALRKRRTAGAAHELEWLISWAQRHKDQDLELTCRSNLANVYDIEGDLFQAVLKDRSAAHLALRMGNVLTWIQIQGNIVNRYMRFGNEGVRPAGQVIQDALARIEDLLRVATSTESRQLIQAGMQRLYGDLVLLSVIAGDAEGALGAAERARGRNTAGWIGAERLVGDLGVDESLKERLRGLLMQLRAADTAAEEHMLIGPITTKSLNSLREARRQIQSAMTSSLARVPDATAAIEQALRGEEMRWSDARQVLASVPDSAVLYLFGLPEGVISLVLRSDEVRVARAELVKWPQDERIKALRRWAGPLMTHSGRAAGTGEHVLDGDQAAVGLRLSRHLLPVQQAAAGQATVLERLREEFFARLFPLFGDRWPSSLAIVPHRELQLIPFHEFFLEVAPHTCLTIAPSLHVLVNCLRRQPTGHGSTVLVGDMTGTLPFARREVDLIRQVRAGKCVAEPSSVAELHAELPGADLLVCAAHGIFDSVNPYRSGLAVFAANMHAPPALSVADVLSKVRLPDCRLVILSACESGVSRQHAADEYTGLPAAFLIAGAKTVIATQWPVGDDAALLMTGEFMRRWQGGSGHEPSPARALHEARTAVRAMPAAEVVGRLGVRPESTAAFPFSDPAHTAAFQVYGAW